MKRLLVICHGFPPYYGGAEHVAYYLARAAVKTGRYRVSVLTSDIGGRLQAKEKMEGMSVIRAPSHKKEWDHHTVPELVSFLRSARAGLDRVVGECEPDHVMAHFTLPAGALARTIHGRWGIPYSVVLHGSDVPGYQPGRFGALYGITRPWIRSIWRKSSRVVAVSEALKELALESWPDGDIAVVHNGVDTSRFQSLDAGRDSRSDEWKRMVVVAQLIERKGIQHLLTGLGEMGETGLKGWCLDVYGTGPYQSELMSMAEKLGISSHVSFKGLAGYDQIPDILRGAELYVLPSLQEGLPLSLLEAMAAGCPIVATGVGGIPNVIDDGNHGLLVQPADPQALREAILRMMSDPEGRGRMGEAARKRVELLDWSRVWRDYECAVFGEQDPNPHRVRDSS